MADFTTIKAEIDANIVPFNDAQEITGEKLNTTLQDMVDEVNSRKEDAIFIAEYDVTTKAQVTAALDDGKKVIAVADGHPYIFSSSNPRYYYFTLVTPGGITHTLILGNSGWQTSEFTPADIDNFDQLNDEVYDLRAESSARDLSHYDIHGNFSASRNTANCYVVAKPGFYRIPLVYGNGIKNGYANSAAYTKVGGASTADFVNHRNTPITTPYIEEMEGCAAAGAFLVWEEAQGLITDVRIVNGDGCRDILFCCASVPITGANAIIGIKDANGNVIWSWHIWAIADDLTPVTLTNHTEVEYDVLPLNLGWTWDSADKLKGKSVFYQWGRKDPMPSPAAYNSSSDHAMYGTMTFQKVAAAEGIADGILNPNKFYIQDQNNNNDWQSGITARYNHWDASCAAAGSSDNVVVKTVYDPSPVGYKMPNARLFTGFTTTGVNTSTPEQFNVIDAFANGWKFKKNGEDLDGEFFAASGYRNRTSGDLNNVGSSGYYWSSAVTGAAYAYYLSFSSGYVNPLNSNNRANGFAVRPVRESN